MIVLALESSCDETAAAILCAQRGLLASEVASQIAVHRVYGGVVPEVASRQHLTHLRPVVDAALAHAGVRREELDAVAATAGPGLATSLMIGLSAAKGLALGLQKPFLAVNHVEGHLLSPFFSGCEGTGGGPAPIPPAIGLVVSGGHTLLVDIDGFGRYRLLGQTRDDAAGEAFDKVGKLLGLPYPGGPVIDRLARGGDPARFAFPRSMLNSGDFAFSFSGLKTAVRYLLPKLPDRSEPTLADVCASFQEAVVDVLVEKTLAAARATGRTSVAVSGGVSCNSRLRARMEEACRKAGLQLRIAGAALSTDNAAMIGWVALHRLAHGLLSPLTADIDPNLRLV
ncbi:MAG: tRNA (adenosine(37)-N6)-threonylcarbamoyltransferase complex transferase subunit TsaD [Chthoniobacteraceae bacterium]|nr:tRNA (adenosine(37)-N6)-threonylcarbamoyltransferase complex transferase subunit TsaD [Chthoniobacteraceae bacterium]